MQQVSHGPQHGGLSSLLTYCCWWSLLCCWYATTDWLVCCHKQHMLTEGATEAGKVTALPSPWLAFCLTVHCRIIKPWIEWCAVGCLPHPGLFPHCQISSFQLHCLAFLKFCFRTEFHLSFIIFFFFSLEVPSLHGPTCGCSRDMGEGTRPVGCRHIPPSRAVFGRNVCLPLAC